LALLLDVKFSLLSVHPQVLIRESDFPVVQRYAEGAILTSTASNALPVKKRMVTLRRAAIFVALLIIVSGSYVFSDTPYAKTAYEKVHTFSTQSFSHASNSAAYLGNTLFETSQGIAIATGSLPKEFIESGADTFANFVTNTVNEVETIGENVSSKVVRLAAVPKEKIGSLANSIGRLDNPSFNSQEKAKIFTGTLKSGFSRTGSFYKATLEGFPHNYEKFFLSYVNGVDIFSRAVVSAEREYVQVMTDRPYVLAQGYLDALSVTPVFYENAFSSYAQGLSLLSEGTADAWTQYINVIRDGGEDSVRLFARIADSPRELLTAYWNTTQEFPGNYANVFNTYISSVDTFASLVGETEWRYGALVKSAFNFEVPVTDVSSLLSQVGGAFDDSGAFVEDTLKEAALGVYDSVSSAGESVRSGAQSLSNRAKDTILGWFDFGEPVESEKFVVVPDTTPTKESPLLEPSVVERIVERVVDGDTLDLAVDLGFKVQVRERFRLIGVDTPEVYGANKSTEGEKASAFVKDLLPQGTPVVVETSKGTGKYGRWLATIYPDDGDDRSLNQRLLDEGLAKPYPM